MDLSLGLVLAGIGVFSIVALAAVWLVPRWQARRWAAAGIAGKELAELENGARSTTVQLIGGVALILTFAATWAQIADTRRATDETLELTALQQENERFSRALTQLESKRLEIRVGAIAGLGAIAQSSATQREPVVQILLAYLRGRHGHPGVTRRLLVAPRSPCTGGADRFAEAAADAQVATSVLLATQVRDRPYNLAGLNLAGLEVEGADFSRANLIQTSLAWGDLNGARFDRAQLLGTEFFRACLRGASLAGANALGVNLDQANLEAADLRRAQLGSANLPLAYLADVHFDAADLRSANLAGAVLGGATFEGSDLRGADLSDTDVTKEQLVGARLGKCTRLPWGTRVARGCRPAGSRG